jgi:hypothetical protein
MVMPEWSKCCSLIGKHGVTFEKLREMFLDLSGSKMYENEIYTVVVREAGSGVTHLSIRRNDRGAARDWRQFQQIKNDICGKDREAIELYPAEHRVVDTANQFHLWVLPEGVTIPVGFPSGLKAYDRDPSGLGGSQRGLDEEVS